MRLEFKGQAQCSPLLFFLTDAYVVPGTNRVLQAVFLSGILQSSISGGTADLRIVLAHGDPSVSPRVFCFVLF